MLIIDEPELHLHRSLMDKLWNTVERLCPDTSLVYITHDLDFAASRTGARKIWIQSFSSSAWHWVDVPTEEQLPEPLILEIIGSRKPTLFCEGERGGLDHLIYQLCLPHLHVLPRGGSDQVVEATKALRANAALHTLATSGIVDRDVRTGAEVEALEKQGISVLKFAEIENVLCSRVVVQAVASQLKLDEGTTLTRVAHYVITALQSELDAQVALRAARRIRYHLSCYSAPSSDPASLGQAVADLVASLDTAAIISAERTALEAVIASGDLDSVLALYNRKSLPDRIAPLFGLKPGQYTEMVLRMLKSADGGSFAAAIKPTLASL